MTREDTKLAIYRWLFRKWSDADTWRMHRLQLYPRPAVIRGGNIAVDVIQYGWERVMTGPMELRVSSVQVLARHSEALFPHYSHGVWLG